MSYLFFIADKGKQFDRGDGTEGSLGEHLEYVSEFGGTPDSWDSVDTKSRIAAMNEARSSGLHLYIVDESSYRVVGEVNKPEED